MAQYSLLHEDNHDNFKTSVYVQLYTEGLGSPERRLLTPLAQHRAHQHLAV